jgi:Fur family ferric uptake transcriptional regulator
MSCHIILQKKGYRLTPQRVEIIRILHNSNQHISADEIYTKLKTKFLYANKSTVYRTLELLKEENLVIDSILEDKIIRYHIAAKGDHHHLICSKCNKIISIPEDIFEATRKIIEEKYGFEISIKHEILIGLCSDCRKS